MTIKDSQRMAEDLTPDGRYLADQQCWPGRDECSFATGVFGETVGVAATRAPVRRDPSFPVPTNHPPQVAPPALSEEARRGIVRRIERLRCARDAIDAEIFELDRELDG